MDEADESPLAGRAAEGSPDNADDGDDTPDWMAFAGFARTLSKQKNTGGTAEPVIPKRGEKDFEPASEERHVHRQTSLLDASRAALFTAISSGTRYHSSRTHNRAIWDAGQSRAYMVDAPDPSEPPYTHAQARKTMSEQEQSKPASVHGIHFQSAGQWVASRKRLELLPEEALYLLERGTIECWSGEGPKAVPMSVQHAWTRMINADELTPERYQIYAYLRRLGYTVIRATPPDPFPFVPPQLQGSTMTITAYQFINRMRLAIAAAPSDILGRVRQVLFGPALTALWRLRLVSDGTRASLVGSERWFTYDNLFTRLQFVRAGRAVQVDHAKRKEHPYRAFYHVYKPITKFKKTDPPVPDFRIAVINAQLTPVPDLYDFAKVFDDLPLSLNSALPLPLPVSHQDRQTKPHPSTSLFHDVLLLASRLSEALGGRAFVAPPLPITTSKGRKPIPAGSTTRPAPYARLKAGAKSAIVAVVDNGTISFQRFGDTDFAEYPWVGNALRGHSSPLESTPF